MTFVHTSIHAPILSLLSIDTRERMSRTVLVVVGLIGLALSCITDAAPTLVQTGTNTFTGDGSTVNNLMATQFTTPNVLSLSLAANTLYEFDISGWTSVGFMDVTTWGVTIHGTWFPLVGPVDPNYGESRRDFNLWIHVLQVSAVSASGIVSYDLSAGFSLGDAYTETVRTSTEQVATVTTGAITGTIVIAPGLISESGIAINTRGCTMKTLKKQLALA